MCWQRWIDLDIPCSLNTVNTWSQPYAIQLDDNRSIVDVGDVSELLSGVNYHWRDGHSRAGAGYVLNNRNAVVNTTLLDCG